MTYIAYLYCLCEKSFQKKKKNQTNERKEDKKKRFIFSIYKIYEKSERRLAVWSKK